MMAYQWITADGESRLVSGGATLLTIPRRDDEQDVCRWMKCA